jgi:hypothetical protein
MKVGRQGLTLVVGAAAAAVGLLLGQGLVVAASAVFSDAAEVPANEFGTAATYPTYPETVTADAPLFYHRLDDTAGSTTAADSSGNGSTGVYTPGTAADNVALVMPFDENAGTVARDLSGAVPPHDGTLNGATWTSSGRANSAVSFNGSSNYVTTSGPVVNTAASFSVSAWVNLTSSSAVRTAVSQIGTTAGGFYLQFRPGLPNRWAFQMPTVDTILPALDTAQSSSIPALNTWTHLLGVFDAAAGQMRLYVNGVLEATVSHLLTWNATGAVEVGSGRSLGSRADYWAGRIDEVRMYSGVVSAAGAAELAGGVTAGARPTWQFDENTGTTTQDRSGGDNPGTLAGGAGWGAGPPGGGTAVALNGSTGHVTAARSAVRTDQSFTVTARVLLTSTSGHRAIVSQEGQAVSGFFLKYDPTVAQFVFMMPDTDQNGPAVVQANGTASVFTNTWYHVTGVYDAAANQLRIYQNGALQSTVTRTASWNAAGAMVAGRGRWDSSDADFLAGRIDDVQVYQRALSGPDVANLFNGRGVSSDTLGMSGALVGPESGSTAVAFSSLARNGYHPDPYADPVSFTLECWFLASGPWVGTSPGTLLSFGDAASGDSTVRDRGVYLTSAGDVVFGSASGASGTVQTSGVDYLDGAWHYLAAVLSPAGGMRLYVDGQLAATGPYLAPGGFTGYWRWGGDFSDAAWPSDYFLGTIDEVAVYATALSGQRIAVHYYANR